MALEYEVGGPKITKDGVTIAKSIYLGNREEQLGCKLLQGASGTTNLFAGDGTTSSVILTRELIREGIKAIEYGMHPIDIKIGMSAAADTIMGELKAMARHIPATKGDIFRVAMVATNYDEKVSALLSDGLSLLGRDGMFMFDEAPGVESSIELSHGSTFSRGYVSPEFVTNTFSKM